MTGSTCSRLICDKDYDKYVCDCRMAGTGCYMVLEEHYRVYPVTGSAKGTELQGNRSEHRKGTMGRIRNVAVVGMGALGLLFGQRIRENLGDEHLLFLMDEARKKRHSLDEYRINGKAVSFRMASPDEMKGPFDLIIVATKYSGLYEARDLIRTVVGPDTVIVSLLNGISSEKILAEVFEREQIIDCVAIGLDAVREGTSLTYQHMGRWQVGSVMKEQEKNLADLTQFLDASGIEYEVCSDIRRAMWNKFIKQQRNPEPKPQKRPEQKPGKKPRQKKQLKTML